MLDLQKLAVIQDSILAAILDLQCQPDLLATRNAILNRASCARDGQESSTVGPRIELIIAYAAGFAL